MHAIGIQGSDAIGDAVCGALLSTRMDDMFRGQIQVEKHKLKPSKAARLRF